MRRRRCSPRSSGRSMTGTGAGRGACSPISIRSSPAAAGASSGTRGMSRRTLSSILVILALVASTTGARAAVTRVEITHREPYAEGRAFGEAGAYERLRGRVRFAVDPRAAPNRRVVDLEL